ncbi:3-phosphoshikimate 1-carboxyvinyltransferase [Convivina praedatoris]|uniref:3-phosphoshikimate 1-carboxyvinyltransferase n=1 Tax=Convivina praedatoris TaxID=2880963 RepID=A0ABM9D1M1_9LACO|nr:3-phosphoshikimate 1-carboxyvinyltransferase [Convivina sp. LMG 32447]CAH1852088.1 3-phosphoshikimate 1-carboxyvinyltransferase 1 [Convivina sp. LMG 32447]CAH1853884.1 3-phosphoshikimate 1-carboxyvinyltransferase 1 [Convivina sp. LMG 32447]CAH1854209.1 3-phosphoshikimate 1-carboxyvinyltransferase 1 [Convivina sp. LMG 32447]
MIKLNEAPASGLHGELMVPGDKSISHRALMFGAIAQGKTVVERFLASADVYHTMGVLQNLGVQIEEQGDQLIIEGRGLQHFHAPTTALDMGNSGTSTRLLMGLLAKQPFDMPFFGDESLSKRPLKRVSQPLQAMGAHFELTDGDYLPGVIQANNQLRGIRYEMPVASAQVKSALIFAGMQAEGTTTIVSPLASRDHTERMLQKFGGRIDFDGDTIRIEKQPLLQGQHVVVPADISSAAFFIVAALITPNSNITLKGVGINPTRDGILRLLKRMGANIEMVNRHDDEESVADLIIKYQPLHGIEITAADIPATVDELPILALAASQAQGTTTISGAQELRVKETDRIDAVVRVLSQLGVSISERPDGMVIEGGKSLVAHNQKVALSSSGDHRIAMMIAVAALITKGSVSLIDEEAMAISYPTFMADLAQLMPNEEIK